MFMTNPSRALKKPTFSSMNARNGNVQSEHHGCNDSERLVLTWRLQTIVLSAAISLETRIEKGKTDAPNDRSNLTLPLQLRARGYDVRWQLFLVRKVEGREASRVKKIK